MGILARLLRVDEQIVDLEKQLDSLYAERDRLAWQLEEGDHT